MQKVLAYILTPIFIFFFGLILLVFHPIQMFCHKLIGYKAHGFSVALMNRCLMLCTNLLGTSYSFKNNNNLPTDRPLIIVANHQSMFDIPPIIWHMRKHHPKFVSKQELGKGIPSVSYNLRHAGSVLIDRNNNKQALREIAKLGQYIEKHKRSAVIFPEGTRSRDGQPQNFRPTGLKILMKTAPSALIVPISINNSWKLLRYGKFPMGIGNHLKFKVHPPLERSEDLDDFIIQIERKVVSSIE
ncbi:1-acyl-sn-glycerol-3-phosphate acyltransferase [Aurantibacter crassamenti]|uniref:lysophospholipid acyltransferase family protein n=1 Tax=Aurantibacter crassamenti TaxID=1837375 RepID=UPI00193A963C|nr:1-acyl-sn-glycerol-3-phosphate acyltransferase [Aurantibacter crassamenti]MBM1105376.1 1-acyl-sn-glycerol-3-phosphate acyltransferase [Aurantibacter crassamenti]